jgi:hypothetical protein
VKVPIVFGLGVMLLAAPVRLPAQYQPDQLVQWGFGAKVPAYTALRVTDAHHMIRLDDRNSEFIPFRVPDGHCLGLTGAKLASKFREDRASYLVIGGIDTILDHQGMQVWPQPLVLPSGFELFGDDNPVTIINNSREEQWMNAQILGVLRPCPPFGTRAVYRTVFSDWFHR